LDKKNNVREGLFSQEKKPELDKLQQKILDNLAERKFKDLFVKASRCSSNNERLLLLVKPDAYDSISETDFLNKSLFPALVMRLREIIIQNISLVINAPASVDESEVFSMSLGDELDLDDLDDLEGFLDDTDDESDTSDKSESFIFILNKTLKILIILEDKEDYLCIRKWFLMKKLKDHPNTTILHHTMKEGLIELLENDFANVIRKNLARKRTVVSLGMDANSETFSKFSESFDVMKKGISPTTDEVKSFVDFILAGKTIVQKDEEFNLDSFVKIPSFVVKNFGSLTHRLKDVLKNKDENFKKSMVIIQEHIDGLDDDKDLSFFILSEIVKDLSLVIINEMYDKNPGVQKLIDSELDLTNVSQILSNDRDEKYLNASLGIKGLLVPYLNEGWNSIDLEDRENENKKEDEDKKEDDKNKNAEESKK